MRGGGGRAQRRPAWLLLLRAAAGGEKLGKSESKVSRGRGQELGCEFNWVRVILVIGLNLMGRRFIF